MSIVNTLSLESNRQIKINFDGGDLSSDAGLLLIKEFAAKIGFTKLIKSMFKTNDKAVRHHRDDENLMQVIFQIIAAYFEDDCADELTHDPVFRTILDKDVLASQPTLSRFFNRMDEDTIMQFDDIDKSHKKIRGARSLAMLPLPRVWGSPGSSFLSFPYPTRLRRCFSSVCRSEPRWAGCAQNRGNSPLLFQTKH